MNSQDEIRRDFEAAKRGVQPRVINDIPMRPLVAETFDDAKVPLPNIEIKQRD